MSVDRHAHLSRANTRALDEDQEDDKDDTPATQKQLSTILQDFQIESEESEEEDDMEDDESRPLTAEEKRALREKQEADALRNARKLSTRPFECTLEDIRFMSDCLFLLRHLLREPHWRKVSLSLLKPEHLMLWARAAIRQRLRQQWLHEHRHELQPKAKPVPPPNPSVPDTANKNLAKSEYK